MAILIGLMATAIGVALLSKALKERIWLQTNSMKWGRESEDRIIEIHEYEIIDDTHNQSSEGYKVNIQD